MSTSSKESDEDGGTKEEAAGSLGMGTVASKKRTSPDEEVGEDSAPRVKRNTNAAVAIDNLTVALERQAQAFAVAFTQAADRTATILEKQGEMMMEQSQAMVAAFHGMATAMNALARSLGGDNCD
ncbi:hypothetical protein CBR_g36411 [Chara braunii]|uniref:Uncharacterized protein n=1 Tax=Chara braunii TaxID=69332 RepID=A0A388LKY1_CHABU|nr:hypothetical protein CBR_g36411 [Chara braunii]|eukprot:GBG82885.1 hypothetical protein CBR_g36411 [Chara braunii]